MDKVQAVHDYYEGIYASIQSTLCPIEDYMNVHVTSLDINSLRAIYRNREQNQFPNQDISLSPEDFFNEFIHLNINAIQSKAATT